MRNALFVAVLAASTLPGPVHADDPRTMARDHGAPPADDAMPWTDLDPVDVAATAPAYAKPLAPGVTRSEVPLLQQARSVAVINRAVIDAWRGLNRWATRTPG